MDASATCGWQQMATCAQCATPVTYAHAQLLVLKRNNPFLEPLHTPQPCHSHTSTGRAPFTTAFTATLAVNTDASSSFHTSRCSRWRCPRSADISDLGRSLPTSFSGLPSCRPPADACV